MAMAQKIVPKNWIKLAIKGKKNGQKDLRSHKLICLAIARWIRNKALPRVVRSCRDPNSFGPHPTGSPYGKQQCLVVKVSIIRFLNPSQSGIIQQVPFSEHHWYDCCLIQGSLARKQCWGIHSHIQQNIKIARRKIETPSWRHPRVNIVWVESYHIKILVVAIKQVMSINPRLQWLHPGSKTKKNKKRCLWSFEINVTKPSS